jgi:hypothetical protein
MEEEMDAGDGLRFRPKRGEEQKEQPTLESEVAKQEPGKLTKPIRVIERPENYWGTKEGIRERIGKLQGAYDEGERIARETGRMDFFDKSKVYKETKQRITDLELSVGIVHQDSVYTFVEDEKENPEPLKTRVLNKTLDTLGYITRETEKVIATAFFYPHAIDQYKTRDGARSVAILGSNMIIWGGYGIGLLIGEEEGRIIGLSVMATLGLTNLISLSCKDAEAKAKR